MRAVDEHEMPLLSNDTGTRRAGVGQSIGERKRLRTRMQQLMTRLFLAVCVCTTAIVSIQWLFWVPHALQSRAPRRFEDSLVLTMKTGSAVLYNRSPIQLMQLSSSQESRDEAHWHEYIPNFVVYSDSNEIVGNVRIRDVLGSIPDDVMRSAESFGEYRRIHHLLANNLDPSASSTRDSDSRGWELDKYKFLPLHADAASRFPHAKYTISVEADTFIFWNQVVKWLKRQEEEGGGPDALKMWGSAALYGDTAFAHGGSGYVMSRGLIHSTFGSDPDFQNNSTFLTLLEDACCGDVVLAQALQMKLPGWEANFNESEGLFVGQSPSLFGFGLEDWCNPVFTLHGITSFDYVQLHKFKRLVEPLVGREDYIRRVDLWDGIMPAFLREPVPTANQDDAQPKVEVLDGQVVKVEGWRGIPDGQGDLKQDATTERQCRALCDQAGDEECLMWTFNSSDEKCVHSSTVFIGNAAGGFITAYAKSRIDDLRARQECSGRLGDIGALMAQLHQQSTEASKH